MAYADAYQSLLEAYNDRQPAESLYAQIGKNLSKRIATEAERSNLSFIAIYGGVAQWNQNNLVGKLLALTSSSIEDINEKSLTRDEKRYRTEHYINLIVLCVVSHLKNEVKTYDDIIIAIKENVDLIPMHSDVSRRLTSLKAHNLKYILEKFNFGYSYKLAKEYVNLYEFIKKSTEEMPGQLLRLSPNQVIQYKEALRVIAELNKAYEGRKTTISPATDARASLNTTLPAEKTPGSKVSFKKDGSDGSQKSLSSVSAAGGGVRSRAEAIPRKSMIAMGNPAANRVAVTDIASQIAPAATKTKEDADSGKNEATQREKLRREEAKAPTQKKTTVPARAPLNASVSAAGGGSDEIIIEGTEGVWVHHKGDGSLSNGLKTFIDGDWARTEDGRIVIRGNMLMNQGGMILTNGKFIPTPPPPPARVINSGSSPTSGTTENSSVTPKKTYLADIAGAKLRATPQKTEEQKHAEQEKKEKEIVAKKEIDAINVEIKRIENNIIQKRAKKEAEGLKIEKKKTENLENTRKREALTDEINKLNIGKDALTQEKALIDIREADLESKETEIRAVSKVINRDNLERKKVLEEEIEELKTNVLGSSKKKTQINKRILTLDQELTRANK